jgi:hypothetical protein
VGRVGFYRFVIRILEVMPRTVAVVALLLIESTCALRLATNAPSSAVMGARTPLRARHLLMQSDDEKELLTLATLPESTRELIDMALEIRNKERILEGQPKYESVEGMVGPASAAATLVRPYAHAGTMAASQKVKRPSHDSTLCSSPCTGGVVHGV